MEIDEEDVKCVIKPKNKKKYDIFAKKIIYCQK